MPIIIEGSIVTDYKADTAEYFNDGMEITVPEGITIIGENAFAPFNRITRIHLPDSVVSIHPNAFHNCGELKEINIPAKTSYIGEEVFSFCTELTAIHVDAGNEYFCDVNGVLYDREKKTLLRFPPGKEMDIYSVPEGAG